MPCPALLFPNPEDRVKYSTNIESLLCVLLCDALGNAPAVLCPRGLTPSEGGWPAAQTLRTHPSPLNLTSPALTQDSRKHRSVNVSRR